MNDEKNSPADKIVGSTDVLDAGQFFTVNKVKYLAEHNRHCISPFAGRFSDNCAWCNPYEARRRWLASNLK